MPTKKTPKTRTPRWRGPRNDGEPIFFDGKPIFFDDGFGSMDRFGYASLSEQERHLAMEMSYAGTGRVTKQEPFNGVSGSSSVLLQEARGTREMITSDQLPAKMDQEALKQMGIEILGPSQGDELFVDVKLPQGWTKVRSETDSRTTYLVDPAGNKRAYMWYKASSYDRAAYGGIRKRFDIVHRSFNDYKVGVAWVVDDRDPIKQVPVFQTADRTYETTREGLSDEARQELVAECIAWLDKSYPDWRDCTAYWDIPTPKTVGKIPPWDKRTR